MTVNKHDLQVGDCVDVPRQVMVGNLIAREGIGTITSFRSHMECTKERYTAMVKLDGTGEIREYFPKDLRYNNI